MGDVAHKALLYLRPCLIGITFSQVNHLRLRELAELPAATELGGAELSQSGLFAVTLLLLPGPGPPTARKGEDETRRTPLPQPYACLLHLPSKLEK